MRRVAGSATLDLNRRMLIDEGTRYLGMALGADRILIRSRPELISLGCAMGVMAVGTLQHALFHRMMKGLGEGHFNVGMAVFAKLRLGGFEEGRFGLGGVVAVATDAAKACFGVGGAPKVRMDSGVAAEAGSIDLFGGCLAEVENLCRISARVNVGFARPMAGFARSTLAAMR